MNRTQNTPGPWQAHTSEVNYQSYEWLQGSISVGDPWDHTHRTVAFVASQGGEETIPEAHANARLIAAAPDLLAVCRFALGLCDDLSIADSHRTASDIRTQAREGAERLREAIARATGDEPGETATLFCELMAIEQRPFPDERSER